MHSASAPSGPAVTVHGSAMDSMKAGAVVDRSTIRNNWSIYPILLNS